MARHGLDDIGHHQDFRFGQEVGSRLAVRIPGTVDPLVVFQNHTGERPGKVRVFQDLVALERVLLDQRELVARERRRLAQDFRGDRDLAEVVEDRRDPDSLRLFRREPHREGDPFGQQGDALLVPRGVGIRFSTIVEMM